MRIPLLLYIAALAARLVAVALFPDPAYPDSFYYVDVARQLAAGHGFSIDAIWIFPEVGGSIPENPVLPIPSNAHWMPLASIVQVPFIWLLGPTAVASALPFALFGALAAPLAWAIARDAGTGRTVAVGAGLLTALPGLSFAFMAQPDNFSLYQPLAAGALWLGARGLVRGSTPAFVGAGFLAGLATLSRNDGVLLVVALVAALAWDRWRRGGRIRWAAAIGSLGVFLVTVAPWYARQVAVFGTLSPSTASGKVLFIRNIGEWDSITTPATLDHLLGMGLGPLLLTRVGGLVDGAFIFTLLIGALVLVPPMLIGAWRHRSTLTFLPFYAYVVLFFAFTGLVSAIHVPGGTFLHSAVALAPFAYVLALEGVVAIADRVTRRRPADAPGARGLLVGTAVAFGIVAVVVGTLRFQGSWADKRDRMQAVSAALDQAGAPASDRVMSIDAAGYRYWTGHPGVVLVNDALDTVEQVARAYAIRWLVLEKADTVPAAREILAGGPRPAWLGPAILARDDVSVYPVCVEPGDARCGATAGAAEARP